MKSFYSIISISPNSNDHERMSLGIIASSGKELFFLYSNRKKRLINQFLTENKDVLDFILRELDNKIKETNKLNKAREKSLFQLNQLLDGEYFNYLKNYSNGLLLFSEPNYIAIKLDKKYVQKLFKLFVDPIETKTKKSDKASIEKFRERVSKNLISKVKDKVHTDYQINSSIVQTVDSPYNLDCVGKNGSLISAKAIPFSSSMETLLRNINTYVSIMSHLSRNYSNLSDDQFYLIADEPEQRSSNQFKYLQKLKEGEMLQIISSDDAEKVAYEIQKKGAKTFLVA